MYLKWVNEANNRPTGHEGDVQRKTDCAKTSNGAKQYAREKQNWRLRSDDNLRVSAVTCDVALPSRICRWSLRIYRKADEAGPSDSYLRV